MNNRPPAGLSWARRADSRRSPCFREKGAIGFITILKTGSSELGSWLICWQATSFSIRKSQRHSRHLIESLFGTASSSPISVDIFRLCIASGSWSKLKPHPEQTAAYSSPYTTIYHWLTHNPIGERRGQGTPAGKNTKFFPLLLFPCRFCPWAMPEPMGKRAGSAAVLRAWTGTANRNERRDVVKA